MTENAYALRPWTQVAKPHEDILKGDLDLSSYAANLGDVDVGSERCPMVYRDPIAFYNATYRTKALDELLSGVVGVMAGGAGNRVIQLRTPFGGGKTHSLIALLHLVRSRRELETSNLVGGLPDPGHASRVIVLPCLDLSAAGGRDAGGRRLQTLWGELAYRVGGAEGHEAMRAADQARVAPGGEILRRLLEVKPSLVLIDEVLTYVEAALGVALGDTNLGRQTMLFLQQLTEVVRGLPHAAMVYSLQKSVREAVGDETLLETLDQLVSRIDAKKEPVSGDDVLSVVQRRLFADLGPENVRDAVARGYGKLTRRFLEHTAQTVSERKSAVTQAALLEERVLKAYPFHPELLDLMYHRWGTLPHYQRTRGALQFLACTVAALWKRGEAGALIGPGDVPLDDDATRNAFFSQVGEREQMTAVLASDLTGPNARAKRVDEILSGDIPAYAHQRPATRLGRAVALYSFGARPGEDQGVVRFDLLGAVQTPELPAEQLDPALEALSDHLLYIHSTGRRFRFLKEPNLNKLIDEELKKLESDEVQGTVRKALHKTLDATVGFELWPSKNERVKEEPRFQIVFMGPDRALDEEGVQKRTAREWVESFGGRKRVNRNALAFAWPSPAALDSALKAARTKMAIESLESDASRYKLKQDQLDDLAIKRKRAETDLVVAIRQLYPTVWLPGPSPAEAQDPIEVTRVDVHAHQALGGGLVEAIQKALEKHVFQEVMPGKIVSLLRLGEGDVRSRGHWVEAPDVVTRFFGSVQFPKLVSSEALQKSIANAVSKKILGLVVGGHTEGDTVVPATVLAVAFGGEVDRSDVDLTKGSYLVSAELAKLLRTAKTEAVADDEVDEDVEVERADDHDQGKDDVDAGTKNTGVGGTGGGHENEVQVADAKSVRLTFTAKGAQLYAAFNALQWLMQWATKGFQAHVVVNASGEKPLDRHTYTESVLQALEEEDIPFTSDGK